MKYSWRHRLSDTVISEARQFVNTDDDLFENIFSTGFMFVYEHHVEVISSILNQLLQLESPLSKEKIITEVIYFLQRN